MKTKFVLVGLIPLGLAACATGPTQHAIHAECRLEMDAARTAIQLRNKGKDKRTMLQTLPPLQHDSTRLLHQMYQVVDEAYTFTDLNDVIYGIYRYEYCARQLRHQRVPSKFETVYPQLRTCQAHFDRHATKQTVTCVRSVFAPPNRK